MAQPAGRRAPAKGKNGTRGGPAAGFDENIATEQELLAECDRHERDIAAAEKRMLKTVTATHEVGAATCEKLHEQGEQLKRIKGDQKKVGENLKTSAKIMRSLESWSGMIASSMGLNKGIEERAHKTDGKVGKRPNDDITDPDTTLPKRKSFSALPAGPGGEQDNMTQISHTIAALKAQADEMNSELKAQGKMIDELTAEADNQTGQLKHNNARANKMLGRKKAGQDDDDDDSLVPSMNPAKGFF